MDQTIRSISDDDICSGCDHLELQGEGMATCAKHFPARLNLDGYAVRCIELVPMPEYEKRVRQLEAEGMSRSDAQGVAEAEGVSE